MDIASLALSAIDCNLSSFSCNPLTSSLFSLICFSISSVPSFVSNSLISFS